MRTTVALADDLLAEAKERAARSGRTVNEVLEDAIRIGFERHAEAERREIHLITDPTPGVLLPGVDLNNNAALFDLLESEE
jgi:hypothetical protein